MKITLDISIIIIIITQHQKESFNNSENLIDYYGKCSKISNTLKLRTPKIITENNF